MHLQADTSESAIALAFRGAILKGDLPSLRELFGSGNTIEELISSSPTAPVLALHRPKVLEFLIDQGMSITGKHGSSASPLLLLAASNEMVESMQILVDAGALVDQMDNIKRTALHLASNAGSVEAIEILLNAGADIEASCASGFTPLFYAVSNNRLDAVKLLLSEGGNASYVTFQQDTLLHLATTLDSPPPALYLTLFAAGAPLDARNKGGHTPADLARIRNRHGFLAALEYWQLGASAGPVPSTSINRRARL